MCTARHHLWGAGRRCAFSFARRCALSGHAVQLARRRSGEHGPEAAFRLTLCRDADSSSFRVTSALCDRVKVRQNAHNISENPHAWLHSPENEMINSSVQEEGIDPALNMLHIKRLLNAH